MITVYYASSDVIMNLSKYEDNVNYYMTDLKEFYSNGSSVPALVEFGIDENKAIITGVMYIQDNKVYMMVDNQLQEVGEAYEIGLDIELPDEIQDKDTSWKGASKRLQTMSLRSNPNIQLLSSPEEDEDIDTTPATKAYVDEKIRDMQAQMEAYKEEFDGRYDLINSANAAYANAINYIDQRLKWTDWG